jgi:putative transposase
MVGFASKRSQIYGMGKYKKLTHAIYYCVYHIVWVPKYRYRVLTGAVQEMLERDIRGMSEWMDGM